MEDKDERPVLEGDAAVALWKEGRDAWNAWIAANPGARIDFSDVDFSPYRVDGKDISFHGYNFGDEGVSFMNAQFGDGDVSFTDANFGNGYVVFMDAKFGNGNVSFMDAQFGDGDVSFMDANFENGNVSFMNANFGDSAVDFSHARFGDGEADFACMKFGSGEVNFRHAQFGEGRISFWSTHFGNGAVSFSATHFGDGDVDFTCSRFGDGTVAFMIANFGDGNVHFERAVIMGRLLFAPNKMRSQSLDFSSIIVRGSADFLLPPSPNDCLKKISFRSGVFEGPFTLGGTLPAPPDLRSIKAAHHVDLSELRSTLQRKAPRFAWPPVLSRDVHESDAAAADAARFRRLKQFAEENRDHTAALRFAADENRAKRWHETGWFASVLDMAFSAFSDYGQSIWRPMAGLVTLTVLTAGFYGLFGLDGTATEKGSWADAFSLAVGNAIAFVPQSRSMRDDAVVTLFGEDPGIWADLAILGQASLSFVFLFLIGLGLRNRFRL